MSPVRFSSSKDEVTNTDIMAALKQLRDELKGHSNELKEHNAELKSQAKDLKSQADRIEKHDKRISSLESMRELVLTMHDTLNDVKSEQTRIRQILDAHDVSFAKALRQGVKEIVEKTRAGALDDVRSVLASVDCPNCHIRKLSGGNS
jgi:chromosome segregation ATPase